MKASPFPTSLLIALLALPVVSAEPAAAPAQAVAAEPAAAKDAKPGYLGVQLEETRAAQIDDPNAKKSEGVGVLRVIDDAPAAKAGLKDGDRLLAVDGKEVSETKQLRDLIRAGKPDQVVKLTVQRDGKKIEVKVTLGAAPDMAVPFQLGVGQGPPAVPGVVVFNRIINFQGDADAPASGTKKSASEMDVVSLRDGNRFTGRVQSLDPEKGLVLRRDGAPDVELLSTGIASLTFAERANGEAPATKINLQLRDGSWFAGDALTMEQGKISLTLPGGQQLVIPKEQARLVTLSEGAAPQIYDGPVSIAGWTSGRSGQGNWDYKDGFLRCLTNGAVGRNIGRMPDPLDLSFEVLFPRQLQHFGLSLFANGLNQTTAGSLSIQFNPQQIHGNHFDGRRYNQYNVDLNPAADANTGKATICRYRLLVDRVKGKALVYIDGVKQAEWKLSTVKPEEIEQCGSFLSFSPNVFMSNQSFQIGRIRLMPWNGKEPASGKEPVEPKSDQIISIDAPARDGRIERITDREIVFADPPGVLVREKTLYVRFAASSAPAGEIPQATASLRLKHGGEFGVTQARGSDGMMTFTTRFGSEITLPLAALRDLEFLSGPNQPDPAVAGLDLLTLTTGAQFKGKLISPMSGDNLRWKIAAARAALEFPMKDVAGIVFAPAKAPEETPALTGSGAARILNGDWLPGDIVSLDGKQLVLKSNLSPALVVPLASLRSLFVNPEAAASLSDGATGRELWNRGWNPNRAFMPKEQLEILSRLQETWSYHDGAYTISGSARNTSAGLGRKWPAYPGPYALNFEIENPSGVSSLHIQLFDTKDQRIFTIYSFGSRLNVYYNPASGRANRFIGGARQIQVEDPLKSQDRRCRMSLVLDRPARTFRLFVDGKEIGKIAFKEDEAKEALDVGGMTITPMSGGAQSRVANIWLGPWEGVPAKARDGSEKQEPQENSPPQPTIYLANGDEFVGKIGSINAGLLNVDSEAGELDLPLQRVGWLHFPNASAAPAAHFPRLRFFDRGTLSINELQIENDRLRCQTLQGQVLEFPISLVKEIVYRAVQ